MNLFDLVAGFVLLISALIGLSRGLVKELVALFAFTAATALALYLLPFSVSFVSRSVHQPWAAKGAAFVGVFLLAYFGLRLLGSHLSHPAKPEHVGDAGPHRGAGLRRGAGHGGAGRRLSGVLRCAVRPAAAIADPSQAVSVGARRRPHPRLPGAREPSRNGGLWCGLEVAHGRRRRPGVRSSRIADIRRRCAPSGLCFTVTGPALFHRERATASTSPSSPRPGGVSP